VPLTEKLVSICIPTYNRLEKLKRAVSSLNCQNYENFEILISDNCSEDGTEYFCRQLQAQDSRVKYFRHESNIGPTPNFEFVRKQARGEYFLWLGDDDFLTPNYVSECVKKLESDASLILVSGIGAYHRGDLETTHYGNIIQLSNRWSFLRIVKYLWMVQENSIFCGLYRTDSVMSCTLPNILGGDWAWLSSVAMHGRVCVLSQVYVHREFGDSSSASFARLVKIYGFPLWASNYPGIAIALGISTYFRTLRTANGGWAWIKNYLYAVGVLFTLLTRAFYLSLREVLSRITFIQKIVRYCKGSTSN